MSKLAKALTAAAGNAGGESVYVDDVFSTYLYDGNGSSVTVNNGIDLSGEGGMVWVKNRTSSPSHAIYDTERGPSTGTSSTTNKTLASNLTDAEGISGNVAGITSFNSNGFTTASDQISPYNVTGPSTQDYVSWTFRKQAGFFDVVTYTGTGVARTISHNLGSTPAVIIVKGLDIAENWIVYHTSLGATKYIQLNTTGAAGTYSAAWNNTAPTSTDFTVGTFNAVNESGYSYVAYLFADDDQSFGDNSDESIIKCGSYTTDANEDATINLGWEPQWLLVKRSDSSVAGDWRIIDNMRGWEADGNAAYLEPNTSDAEAQTGDGRYYLTSTGFKQDNFGANRDFIYIAIRRPMKTPESGTEVFTPNAYTGNGATRVLTSSNDPVDLGIIRGRGGSADWIWSDRLRGATKTLYSNYSSSEATQSTYITGFDVQDGMEVGTGTAVNGSGSTYISYMLSRATGFFDVVAYTGTGATSGSPNTHNHNLVVAPELIICKNRTTAGSNWFVYVSALGENKGLVLNGTGAEIGYNIGFTNIGASTFQTFDSNDTNSANFIAYLFATLAGVSKVGSYTGTGSDQNIDCGFSSSPRFLMIKRTDSTGDWYVWDSARGIVAGNDPRLQINSGSGGETTSQDWIDPYSSGFALVGGNQPNISGGTYIFLAIA